MTNETFDTILRHLNFIDRRAKDTEVSEYLGVVRKLLAKIEGERQAYEQCYKQLQTTFDSYSINYQK